MTARQIAEQIMQHYRDPVLRILMPESKAGISGDLMREYVSAE
jgi:hypothetical protein